MKPHSKEGQMRWGHVDYWTKLGCQCGRFCIFQRGFWTQFPFISVRGVLPPCTFCLSDHVRAFTLINQSFYKVLLILRCKHSGGPSLSPAAKCKNMISILTAVLFVCLRDAGEMLRLLRIHLSVCQQPSRSGWIRLLEHKQGDTQIAHVTHIYCSLSSYSTRTKMSGSRTLTDVEDLGHAQFNIISASPSPLSPQPNPKISSTPNLSKQSILQGAPASVQLNPRLSHLILSLSV